MRMLAAQIIEWSSDFPLWSIPPIEDRKIINENEMKRSTCLCCMNNVNKFVGSPRLGHDKAAIDRKKSLPLSRSIVLSQEQTRRHDCTWLASWLVRFALSAGGCLISLDDEEDNEGELRGGRRRREKEKVDSSVSCTAHVAEARAH